jgi:hypothetical protein
MDQFLRDPNRNTIIVVNAIASRSLDDFILAVKKLEIILSRKLRVVYVVEKHDKAAVRTVLPKGFERVVCSTASIIQVEKALKPYLDNVIAIVCRSEKDLPYFRNIIPHLPYIEAPSPTSIDWASDKINMRRRLRVFNKKISPPYTIVEEITDEKIEDIKKQVGFPLIVKPAGLAASVLVQVCYHEEELKKTLIKTFKNAKAVYKRRGRLTNPRILVEKFMEGDMYTTDVYVNSRGTMYTTPLVSVLTGFSGGQDDFYGYRQMTPVTLKPHKHQAAFNVAKEAVEALGLRSITAHVELMRTESGWKVIEVNARVGGFRDFLYSTVYGIDHTLNDILIRLPMRPVVPRKPKGYAAVIKMYPKEEGVIEGTRGLKKIATFSSYDHHDLNLGKGSDAYFARHGGISVLDIYLKAKDRSDILADIRRIEQTIVIDVKKRRKPAKVVPEEVVINK